MPLHMPGFYCQLHLFHSDGVGAELSINGVVRLQWQLEKDSMDGGILVQTLDGRQDVSLSTLSREVEVVDLYPNLLGCLGLHTDVDIGVISVSDLVGEWREGERRTGTCVLRWLLCAL